MRLSDNTYNKDKNKSILGKSVPEGDEIILMINSGGKSEVVTLGDQTDFNCAFALIDKYRKEKQSVKIFSKKLKIIYEKLKIKPTEGIYLIDFTNNTTETYRRYIKRVIDLMVTFFSLILLSPLMIFISFLVKLTSAGPVFFSQDRIGLNGRIFKIYKFRTMYQLPGEDEERKNNMLVFMKQCETEGNTKIVNSKRITRLGRFLRKTSLDELPQLFNVLRGEMSLVGPRPDLPYVYELYEPWQKKRINVIPGCTGLWQVTGRSKVSFQDSMILDLYYTYKFNFLMDMKILLKTIPVIIFSKGGA